MLDYISQHRQHLDAESCRLLKSTAVCSVKKNSDPLFDMQTTAVCWTQQQLTADCITLDSNAVHT